MAAINPAAWVAWALLLALPIGFGFLALSRLSTPPSANLAGDHDTDEQGGSRS